MLNADRRSRQAEGLSLLQTSCWNPSTFTQVLHIRRALMYFTFLSERNILQTKSDQFIENEAVFGWRASVSSILTSYNLKVL